MFVHMYTFSCLIPLYFLGLNNKNTFISFSLYYTALNLSCVLEYKIMMARPSAKYYKISAFRISHNTDTPKYLITAFMQHLPITTSPWHKAYIIKIVTLQICNGVRGYHKSISKQRHIHIVLLPVMTIWSMGD